VQSIIVSPFIYYLCQDCSLPRYSAVSSAIIAIDDKMKSLSADFAKMRDDTKALEAKVATASSNASASTQDLPSATYADVTRKHVPMSTVRLAKTIATVSNEEKERLDKSNNLVLFGWSEQRKPVCAMSEADRGNNAEKTLLCDVIGSIVDVDISGIHSVFRLGKFNASSKYPRPVKIITSSIILRNTILKHSASIRDKLSCTGKSFFRGDLTLLQRQENAHAGKVLAYMRAQPENKDKKLFVRCVNNVFKIFAVVPPGDGIVSSRWQHQLVCDDPLSRDIPKGPHAVDAPAAPTSSSTGNGAN
jgi:hypothetical protein